MLGQVKIAALIFLVPSISHAENFSVEKVGKSTLQIQKLSKRKKIVLAHEVSAYEVNCARTLVTVWGEWRPHKNFPFKTE